MKAIKLKTLKGHAIYYALDNRIELSNAFDFSKDIDLVFHPSNATPQISISKYTLELTQQCNMRCSYCCYSGSYSQMRTHSPAKMSEEVIQAAIQFIIDTHDKTAQHIWVNFYGGESLLCFNRIQRIVSELRERLDTHVYFSISTNGLLLSPDVIKWICSIDNIQVLVSIDGDKELHDKNRRTIANHGTYETIKQNLLFFSENYPEEFNRRVIILSTIKSVVDNEELQDIWAQTYLKDKLPNVVSVITPNFKTPTTFPTIEELDDYYKKAFRRHIKSEDNLITRSLETLIKPIAERNMSVLTENNPISTCINNVYTCYIDTFGQLYPCEKVCSDLKIGSITRGFDIKLINDVSHRYISRLNKMCSKCWAVRLCNRCIANLNYSDKEQEVICNNIRNRTLLALKYYCLTIDAKQLRQKKEKLK